MKWTCCFSWFLAFVGTVSLASGQDPPDIPLASVGNRLAYLDGPVDPYYVHGGFARLTTPQWVGDAQTQAVVVLAIDDMRDPEAYEAYLRPILDRLKRVTGPSGLSVMTNQVDPNHERLQQWLEEGVSVEIHTIDHPCPLLSDSDFAKAKSTYERCVDLMATIPGNEPVAFRMPCCDSMNSPSPRFYEAVFADTTPQKKFLTIDSSVFTITTEADESLPPEWVRDQDGSPRFLKYLPFPSFVNTIRDYPFPYVIGGSCWEFPCIVPSDWEGQNLHQPNNPRTVEDMKAALDVVVHKQGVFNLVFHPHGWMRNDQVVELIDHAESRHPGKVKFLSFWQAQQLLDRELLGGHPIRRSDGSPDHVAIADLNHDGWMDVLRWQPEVSLTARLWQPDAGGWVQVSRPISALRIHAGVLEASGQAALVGVERERLMVFSIQQDAEGRVSWDASPLRLGDDVALDREWAERLRAPLELDGVRLRDLDGDGRCELLVSEGAASLILRQTGSGWIPAPHGMPVGVVLATAEHKDAGVRWVDLDRDGQDELLFSTAQRYLVAKFSGWDQPWQILIDGDRTGGPNPLPELAPFVRPDGTNNGVWAHSGHLWWQNEDTAVLPDKVHRVAFATILGQRAAADGPASQDSQTAASAGSNQADAADADAGDANRTSEAFPGPVEPEDSVATFRSSESLRIELVAAEPLVTDPVAFDWGPDGRLWVAEMRDYPVAEGADHPRRGRVRVLFDDDGDGKYDRAEPFLEGLAYPTGVKAWRNGVLISGAPELIYAEDTDGDMRADVQRVVIQGFGEGNQQHRVNGLRWGLDGWLYLANGDSGGTVSLPGQESGVSIGGRDLRIRPDEGRLELLSGMTQFGRCRDDLGNWFGGNNSDPLWHYVLEDRYLVRNPSYAPPAVKRQVPEQPGPAPVFPASKTLPRFNDFDRADRFTSACGPVVVSYYQGIDRHSTDFGPAGTVDSFVCEPVHNLVHRERMESDGASFRSRRLPIDRSAEFLASTDNWFRPVMVRTGPDGALWIADMYRLVIEHPEWIPQHWQQQLDIHAGHDRGRIYRVYPQRTEPLGGTTRLDGLGDDELVVRLASPYRWQRDMAHQMLVWRDARGAVPALRRMADEGPLLVSRIQALYALESLGGIEPGWLAEVIRRAPPEVACHAVVLGERFLAPSGPVLDSVLSRVPTDDLPLRRQIACSLGYATDAQAATALVRLALASPIEPVVQAAVLSSLRAENVGQVLEGVQQADVAVTADQRAFLRQVLIQAIALGTEATQQTVLAALLEIKNDDALAWRLETLADALARYERRPEGREPLPGFLRDGLEQAMRKAQAWSVDPQVDLTLRLASIQLLRHARRAAPETIDETLAALAQLLDPRQSPDLQIEAAQVALQLDADRTIHRVLPRWSGYSPRMRNRILDRVMAQTALTRKWLEYATELRVDLQLDARRRQQLLTARDEQVAEAARRLFQTDAASEGRADLVARYLPTDDAAGDPVRGQIVFKRVCSSCHQIDGMGHAVGPDLAALSNKSPEFLVTAVLHPNQAVESSFLDYLIETSDGRQFTGLLLAESGSGVTLLGADGKEQRILRSEMEWIQSTGKSLMPEGLEKDLTPAEMHDLIAFLQTHEPQRKQFAGNQPQVAPRRDDGSIRLLAMHAEVYGPSLVFEPHYRNLGFWNSPQDYAAWTVEVPSAGTYEVVFEYACHVDSAGNRFVLSCRDQHVSGEVHATGTWDNYAWRDIGFIQLPAGRSRMILRSDGPLASYLLDLHQIVLYPQ